jgi:hypothetical protein
MWRVLQWLGLGPRCARCGLRLRIEENNGNARLYLDPDLWAARCMALAIAGATPFACPHLRRAAHAVVQPRDADTM